VLVTAWLIVTLLLLANALYVAAEFSIVGVRRSRIRRLAEDRHPMARRLLPYVEPAGLAEYLSVSQIGITVSSLALGAYGEAAFGQQLAHVVAATFGIEADAAHAAASTAILITMGGLQLVLGELLPKSLALQYPTEVALYTVVPMRGSLLLFRPFSFVLNAVTAVLLRIVKVSISPHRHIHSPDEIGLLITESRDGGLLEPEEHRRLHSALRLGLRKAHDLMVPRDRVTMLNVNTPWHDLVRQVAATTFSRIPIFRDTPDHIIGTLRVKDLAARYAAEGPLPLEQLVRPIVGIREDLPADRVLALLRERRAHQGVVVDATGRAIGLITIQDVVSELLHEVKAS
jgi:CBS domain containing-hemolysin-like protein